MTDNTEINENVTGDEGPEDDRQISLENLSFSDIQINLQNPWPAVYQTSSTGTTQMAIMVIPDKYRNSVEDLAELLYTNEKSGGGIRSDNMEMRFQKMTTSKGLIAVVRRLGATDRRLKDWNIHSTAINPLVDLYRKKSGLYIVAGATGAGKTTLAKHIYKEMMFEAGGRGISLEDPIEYSMEGCIGKNGWCLEHEVKNNEWDKGIQMCLRMRPAYIYVGEIRTPSAALEVIKASATGHIVITTIHASRADEAIGRIISLAGGSPDSGGPATVRSEVAKSIIAIATTQLSSYGPDIKLISLQESTTHKDVRDLIEKNMDGALITGGYQKEYKAQRLGSVMR